VNNIFNYLTWIVGDKLALSPLPSLSDIDELAKIFNAIVVLIEPHEFHGYMDLYLDKWRSYGVDVYYAPTPDFHPVDLLELHMINRWISKVIQNNGRVLVHCHGGIGRSGMVAASYLIYSGLDVYNAIEIVRNKRPGALETASQQRVVYDYYLLHESVNIMDFNKHLDYVYSVVDQTTRKHLSKTIQLLIEFMDHLNIHIPNHVEAIYSSLYHCFDKEIIESIRDRKILPESLMSLLFSDNLDSLLINISHTLDQYRDSRVVYTESENLVDKIVVNLYCENDCSELIEKTNWLYRKLEEIVEHRIVLVEQQY